MVEILIDQIPKLGPLIQQRIVESKLENRLTMDRALSNVHHLMAMGTGTAFVDNLENPTSVVILQIIDNPVVFEEKACSVILIYVDRQHRSVQKALDAVKTIENYARSKGCTCIYGASWKFNGTDGDGIGALWLRAGYVEQEVVYRKDLTI